MIDKKKIFLFLFIFICLSYLVLFVSPSYISFNPSESDLFLIKTIRVPKYISSILSGLIFSSFGLIVQLLFKNDLATPYTLGVSSSNIFFIVLVSRLSLNFSIWGLNSSIIFSTLSTIIILFILFKLSFLNNDFLGSILLLGISLNIFFTSLMMLIQYFSDMSELYQMTHWLVGSIEVEDLNSFIPVIIFFLLSTIFVLKKSYFLDLISLNGNLATDRGIDTKNLSIRIFFFQSLALSALLPLTGPIAFVGLIVPNMVRKLFKGNVKTLYIYTCLFGVNFVLFVHLVSISIKSGQVIPIGIITSIIGAIFLIFILLKNDNI